MAQGTDDSSDQGSCEPELAEDGPSDESFLSDLVAAERFKSFLVGRGVAVPDDVIDGLSRLSNRFQSDLTEVRAKEQDRLASRGWRLWS